MKTIAASSIMHALLLLLPLVPHVVLGQHTPGRKLRISGLVQKQLQTPCYSVLLDPKKDDVIVGCKNHIYRLDGNSLEKAEELVNGPVSDNRNCAPAPVQCTDRSTVQTDQENRVLLINEETRPNPTIITCGTAKQGMCFLIKYANFGSSGYFGSPDHQTNYIASRKNTIAFFAKAGNGSVLIVAHEPDHRPKKFSQPLISARRMDVAPAPRINYVFTSADKSFGSYVDLHPDLKENYKINLVYGFQHGNFVYFVSTQQASIKTAIYETRLSRVCLADTTFRSYSEIVINCGSDDARDMFNFATAAHLGVIGGNDHALLNIAGDDQILYVSFMQTSPYTNHADRSHGSVVCGFPMSEVVNRFVTAVSDCFEGKDTSHLLEAIVGRDGDATCVKAGPFRDTFACGASARNAYIGSSVPYESSPLIRIRHEKVTALITYVDEEQTVAAIGTHDGKIIKSLINNTILFNHTFGEDREDKEIRREPVIDKKSQFMYAATGRQVIKFPLKSCAIYSACRSCVASLDPQGCGWCGNRCCSREEDPSISEDDRKACSPVIESFTPSKGPVEGGTEITIYGDNFGSSQSGAEHKILIAGVECLVVDWHNEKISCRTERSEAPEDGKIKVTIKDTSRATGSFDIRGTAESDEKFSFLEPKITDISPTFGPVSGGTLVTVRGSNLDMGSTRKIMLLSQNKNITCTEHTTSGDTLTCIIAPYQFTLDDEKKAIVSKPFHVQFDHWNLTTRFLFELKAGPIIESVKPSGAIKSGNTPIHVYGRNLKSMEASDPRMKLELGKFSVIVPCTIMNNSYMACKSPRVPVDVGPYESRTATITFGMNVTDLPRSAHLKILPDPEVRKFIQGTQKVYIEDPILKIYGANLSAAYDWDIRVGPQEVPCQPLSVDISWSQLECRIHFLDGSKPGIDDKLPVTYKVGHLSGDLGTIHFEHKPRDKVSILIACFSVIIVVVVLGLVGLLIWVRRRKNEKTGFPMQVRYTNDRVPDNDYIGITDRSSDVPLIVPRAPPAIDPSVIAALMDCNKLLAKEWLTMGEVVGKGYFGCVHRARLYKPAEDETVDVAVKTIQDTRDISRHEIEMFIQEAMIMKDFDHPHVLTLIGLCFPDDGSPHVVLPFMANGDLRKYVSDELNMPRVRELIGFGIDVAKGMEYLAAQKFVHRDLAARNCMLDDKGSVKVADFGLSRDVYEQEYYRAESGAKLPIKWMAPECLESKKCTTKSDVWSFGVVMWEILTRGRPPYPEVNNWDMRFYLEEGRRLPQPDSCPSFLYDIMMLCWDEDPDRRPTFTQVVQKIESETKNLEAQTAARRIGLQVTYVNVSRGNYYNSSDADDRGAGAGRSNSRLQSGDGSLAAESGFLSSSSNRSTIPRKPAVSLPVDEHLTRERAVL